MYPRKPKHFLEDPSGGDFWEIEVPAPIDDGHKNNQEDIEEDEELEVVERREDGELTDSEGFDGVGVGGVVLIEFTNLHHGNY